MNDCSLKPLNQARVLPEPPTTRLVTHTVTPVYEYVSHRPVVLSALMTSGVGAGSVQRLYGANGAVQVIAQPVISVMV